MTYESLRRVEGGRVGSRLKALSCFKYTEVLCVILLLKEKEFLKNKFGNQLTGLALKVLFQF